MLPCKQTDCGWHLVYLDWSSADNAAIAAATRGHDMSNTTSFGHAPSAGLFSRLMTTIDRFLMAHADFAVRNGDLPYFGL